ncbi:ketopantoate reductase family protein [Paenibacillus sp. UNC451MF]|uniref:ketopantoate reductase family protein n=1 Tax=Paenibacillus sp. UNC451MF TaxID=1449063 RepID=UPI00055FFFFF|nr:2-dehydropantoate 2-reductase [Paenibacillus sp. UNC451MF]
MKVRVIGAGALGMLIAASLAEAGIQIELVTRSREQADTLSEEGLLLLKKKSDASQQEVIVRPIVMSEDKLELTTGVQAAPDVILLMVKQTAVTEELADKIAAQMKPETRLICFQNGIGHTDILSRSIPAEQIWLAVTTEGAFRHHSRCVEHTGRGLTWLGPLSMPNDQKNEDDLEKKLQKMFQDAGFNVSLSNKITSKVWNKLLINSVINPLTAILQIPNGKLTQLPATMPLMRALFEEGVQLAGKLGIELADDLWEQLLTVCERTAANQSSMLQDIRACRLTELDSITGGLLAKAQQAGMGLPAHRTVYQLVRSIEQQWGKI